MLRPIFNEHFSKRDETPLPEQDTLRAQEAPGSGEGYPHKVAIKDGYIDVGGGLIPGNTAVVPVKSIC